MSMSNTVGATCRPVANDVPVIAVLMNPVPGEMHWPEELTEPCNWYCQVATSGGRQHEFAEVLHGTGPGRAAAAARACAWAWPDAAAGPAQAGPAVNSTAASVPMTHSVARPPRIGHLRFRGCGVMTGRWLERNYFPGCQQEPLRRQRRGVKITRQDFRPGCGRYRPGRLRSPACPAEAGMVRWQARGAGGRRLGLHAYREARAAAEAAPGLRSSQGTDGRRSRCR